MKVFKLDNGVNVWHSDLIRARDGYVVFMEFWEDYNSEGESKGFAYVDIWPEEYKTNGKKNGKWNYYNRLKKHYEYYHNIDYQKIWDETEKETYTAI